MSTKQKTLESPSGASLEKDRRSFVSLLLNIGLAIFLLDGFWQLLSGPPTTSAACRLHAFFFYSGLCLAAVMWIASTNKAIWLKVAMILFAISTNLMVAYESIRRFDERQRELTRGEVVNGRVVYAALGISFAAPTNWNMNLQPFLQKSKPKTGVNAPATGLRYGELAIFFQAAPRVDVANTEQVADSIQLEGGPFIFRSLGRTLGSVRQMEASYRAMPGVRIVQPMRFYQRENADFIEFDLIDETHRIYYRHVFFRSGENRLDFVLTTPGEHASARFDEFIRSIRITRRPTRFND
jgi:hypothetical protein